MRLLMNNSPSDASALITEVVDGGDGVFLWVRLVVNSLLDGLRKRDDISTLRVRLRETPKEIDDLYDRILPSINRIHMVGASKIFQLEKVATPISEITFQEFFAACKLSRKSFNQAILADETSFYFRQMPLEDYVEDFAHVLRTRCGGLLELELFGNTGEVNYIHRTAREYIRKPRTWETLLNHTSHLEFDCCFTLAIVYIQEVKSFMSQDSLLSTDHNMITLEPFWRPFIRQIIRIASTKAKGHIPQLVEEFDRAAQRYSDFHTPPTNQLEHWYKSYYKSTPIDCTNVNCTTYDEICPDQDVSKGDRADLWSTMNLLSACVEDIVSPYVEMKITSDPSLIRLKYDPPLVANCFGSLLLEYLSRNSVLRLLVFLLENNANSNEIYHGHSMWKIFLHIVHAKVSLLGYHDEDFDIIFRAMEIMLQRGADVEVCCIEEKVTWYEIFPGHREHHFEDLVQHCKQPLEFKGVVDIGSSNPSDDSASRISENYNEPWEVRHSLERIIKDTFETDSPDIGAKLLSLVAEKKAEKLAIEKQSRNQTPGSTGGNKGREKKQRNRKKGKGKRVQVAFLDDSDY
ncbi:hypothetical protein EAE96_011042 [Botrytis aclada]|nr:hypothetical protein EAE96_011042 [Botrytis aclada]